MLGPEECCWGVKRNPTREHQKGNEANSVLIFLLLLLLILVAILILILLSALLTALSSEPVDWESLLPDVWIAAHPEHFLTFRRDEASRRLHLATALDVMRPGAGARDPDLVSPSADIHSSLAHVGQVVPGRSRQARSSRISLVESGLRQAAPLCRGHCQADAPVTRFDREVKSFIHSSCNRTSARRH
jgi:hypothetical protein